MLQDHSWALPSPSPHLPKLPSQSVMSVHEFPVASLGNGCWIGPTLSNGWALEVIEVNGRFAVGRISPQILVYLRYLAGPQSCCVRTLPHL